jgi:hypothetical protein
MTGRTVLPRCPPNAARSVVEAAGVDRLAAARGLAAHADSAGTERRPVASPVGRVLFRRRPGRRSVGRGVRIVGLRERPAWRASPTALPDGREGRVP